MSLFGNPSYIKSQQGMAPPQVDVGMKCYYCGKLGIILEISLKESMMNINIEIEGTWVIFLMEEKY